MLRLLALFAQCGFHASVHITPESNISHENKGNGHHGRNLLISEQIPLVSTLGNL